MRDINKRNSFPAFDKSIHGSWLVCVSLLYINKHCFWYGFSNIYTTITNWFSNVEYFIIGNITGYVWNFFFFFRKTCPYHIKRSIYTNHIFAKKCKIYAFSSQCFCFTSRNFILRVEDEYKNIKWQQVVNFWSDCSHFCTFCICNHFMNSSA